MPDELQTVCDHFIKDLIHTFLYYARYDEPAVVAHEFFDKAAHTYKHICHDIGTHYPISCTYLLTQLLIIYDIADVGSERTLIKSVIKIVLPCDIYGVLIYINCRDARSAELFSITGSYEHIKKIKAHFCGFMLTCTKARARVYLDDHHILPLRVRLLPGRLDDKALTDCKGLEILFPVISPVLLPDL